MPPNSALTIGSVPLRNGVLLAPMAGVTDIPFREVAWHHGAGYTVGEMLTAKAELWNTDKSRLRRRSSTAAGPKVIQLAGADPAMLAAAAIAHWQEGATVIDINFGCPAKKVCRRAAGSALLTDEPLLAAIVRAVVAAVPIPVTVKIRTGISPDRRNGVQIARLVEAEGAAAITVHGRTRACKFAGQVEFDTVAAIKQNAAIPVFANGDITTAAGAAQVLKTTGVDGVMIGRAALGQPWLLGEIADPTKRPLSFSDKITTMMHHVRRIHSHYSDNKNNNQTLGVKIARKHVKWYLQNMGYGVAAAQGFNRLVEASEQLDYLAEITSVKEPAAA